MKQKHNTNATQHNTRPPAVVKWGDGGPIRPAPAAQRSGGGGGGAAAPAARPALSVVTVRQPKNTDVYLTWPYGASDYPTLPTADRADRAHGQKDGKGCLLPAAKATGTKPRRYPEHQMTSRGVSFDSAADALAEAQHRLEGVPGLGPGDSVGGRIAEALGRFEARYGREGLRSLLRGEEDER